MNIDFSYPISFISLCFIIGALISGLLYYYQFKKKRVSKINLLILFFLRFITISSLCILLLEPIYYKIDKKIEKPIIVFAQDNSQSILLCKDSTYYQTAYIDSISYLLAKLEEHFDVAKYSFASKVSSEPKFNYTENITNISELNAELKARYFGRNIGAVVLASDGLLNYGSNPLYSNNNLLQQLPVYCIAMGDTNVRKDLSIKSVLNNKIVSLGNDFPVEIQILANKYLNKNINISIYYKSQLLLSKDTLITRDKELIDIKLILKADKIGKRSYKIKISELEDEVTFLNNSSSFYIEVLERKNNILILSEAPHPDIAAIKWVLNDKLNNNVELTLARNFSWNISKYNLIIFHKPSKNTLEKIISKDIMSKIPTLYITGNNLSNKEFNKLNSGVEIVNHSGTSDVDAVLNNDFVLFSLGESFNKTINSYPPLSVPFASNYISKGSQTLIYQKIGLEKTSYPLITLSDVSEIRKGVVIGEGLWKWKMYEYEHNSNAKVFKNLFSKIVNFLVSTKNKDRFIIDIDNEFLDNQKIIFNAQLYNKNYELINNQQVDVRIFVDSNEVLQKLMLPKDDYYKLNINRLPSGKYSYIAKTSIGDEKFIKKGSFIIIERNIELTNLKADHNFLNILSKSNNASVFNDKNISGIYDSILARNDVVNISHKTKIVDDVIKWKIIFYLLCFFLSVEWFLRKRNGLY